MSTGVTLNRELDTLRRTLNIGDLTPADTTSLRAKWEGEKKKVQGIYETTKADIEIYTRALADGEATFKASTKLVRQSPELAREYEIEKQTNTQTKAALESRLAPQEALIARIDAFLGTLPIHVPEATSRCSMITSLFTKQNAIYAGLSLAALMTAVGFALRG